MIVHNNRSVALQTTAKTSYNEVNNPSVGDPATHVEILDWQFTNDSQTQEASNLSAGSIVSPIEIRSVDRSGNFLHFSAGEPTSENCELALSFWGPSWHDFLEVVLGHTKANQVVVLDVFGFLWVDLSSLQIVIGILTE